MRVRAPPAVRCDYYPPWLGVGAPGAQGVEAGGTENTGIAAGQGLGENQRSKKGSGKGAAEPEAAKLELHPASDLSKAAWGRGNHTFPLQ